MRYAQLVIGPAGSGKSTYCSAIVQHAETLNRVINVVNMDPAAEHFDYEPVVDVRELISIEDAMEPDFNYGPNGALVFCLEYLLKNEHWLKEELGEEADDDYILFDCPGQLELYTHLNTVKELVESLQKWNFRICAVFIIDAQFMVDGAKFLSGTMAALSVMVNLELPHVNIISKMDQLEKVDRQKLQDFLDPDPHALLGSMEHTSRWHDKYRKLTEAIGNIIEDYSLVRFLPLNIRNKESLTDVLLTIDNVIQYGEDLDVKTKDFEQEDEEIEN